MTVRVVDFMTYERLMLCCECGQVPDSITEVGLTPLHELVIHWRCVGCCKSVYIFKDLASCWRECPPREEAAQPEDKDIQAGDFAFLDAMGITIPDDGE